MSIEMNSILHDQNQSLQASHQIVNWLERAKSFVDQRLDALPQVYAVIKQDGTILRGNARLSHLMGMSDEQVLHQNLKELFRQSSWELFLHQLSKIPSEDKGYSSQFELAVETKNNNGIVYFYWTVERFDSPQQKGGEIWFSIFGQDVTKIKETEKKLSKIFSSIPLGILLIDSHLNITDPYSIYSEKIVGSKESLAGKKIFDVLFKPCWDKLSLVQREKVTNVLNLIGSNDVQFDLIKDELIKKLSYPWPLNPEKNQKMEIRHLGLSFEPVYRDRVIESLVVIIEDRTEMEKLSEISDTLKKNDERVAQRFSQVKKLDKTILQSVFEDLSGFFKTIQGCVDSQGELINVLRALHGIKGTSRVAGFKELKEITHQIENFFLHGLDAQNPSAWLGEKSRLEVLSQEWKELWRTKRAVEAMDQDEPIHGSPVSQIHSLEGLKDFLEKLFQTTAESLGKKATLHWENLTATWEPMYSPVIKTALLHLITNALDHGIETPETRSRLSKPAQAMVKISHRNLGASGFEIRLEDDGQGIPTDILARIVVEKGLKSSQEVEQMSHKQRCELVWMPGLSSRKESTELSGRGIGMDAVKTAVEQVGGQMEILSLATGKWGTEFVIRFLSEKEGG